MSSFINLMSNDRWSEIDIVNRMEAMIRSVYSATDEQIINRKMTGAGAGFYTLSEQEAAEIANYAAVCLQAQAAGQAARVDMTLLNRVLDHEQGIQLLAEDDAEALALLAQRPQPVVEEIDPELEGVTEVPEEPQLPQEGSTE